jgi:hypothetical protein
MSADLRELELLEHRLSAAVEQIPKVMDDILKDAGKTFIRVAKQNTPVDSGTLRRNWAPENNKVSGSGKSRSLTIINPTEYAEYVDQGHRKIAWRTPNKKPGPTKPFPGGPRRIPKGAVKEYVGWVEGYHMSDKAEAAARKKIDRDGPKILNKMLRETWEGK